MNRVPINPRNRLRATAALAQDFGDEAITVRKLPCSVRDCTGYPVEPAHVKSRGAGGGRFDIVPLCKAHHREQHDHGIKTFAAKFGLDLRAIADHIAVSHSEPNGLRAVARVWAGACRTCSGRGGFESSGASTGCRDCAGIPLGISLYEREALLGWVRRSMDRDAADAASKGVVWSRELASRDVGNALGFVTLLPGWQLCEAAGWPP
jgi:hypothetical protein